VQVEVTASLTKSQLLEAIRRLTIHNENFNPDEWSLFEGQQLIDAGNLIVREIRAKK
jgi:hypothetical protein